MSQSIEIFSEEFRALLRPDSALRKIADGMGFCEGACWAPEGNFLIWSDIPNNRIMRWSETEGVGVFREPSGNANGNTVDLEGRILMCETSGRRVSRRERDGTITTLVDSYGGKKLTSPNDIVVKSDGTVWFTDPDYGYLEKDQGHGQPPEQDGNYVFRFDPATGDMDIVSDHFDKPNGIAFSVDESILYVTDTGATHGADRPHLVRAFDVVGGRSLANPRVLCEVSPHVPDGFRLDVNGNLFVSAGDGVQAFTPAGELIGKIHTPEAAANCSFGMADRRTLFITATSAVWAIDLNTAGAVRPERPS